MFARHVAIHPDGAILGKMVKALLLEIDDGAAYRRHR
jgi:hypothetical protein